MKKFATPLVILNPSYEIELALVTLGYKLYSKGQEGAIITHFGGIPEMMTRIAARTIKQTTDCDWHYINNKKSLPREIVDGANKDLVFALAAMVEGDKFYKGEYLICTCSYKAQFTKGKLYKQRVDDMGYACIELDDLGSQNGFGSDRFRKATKEEIMVHFNNVKWANGLYKNELQPEIGDEVIVVQDTKDQKSQWDGHVGILKEIGPNDRVKGYYYVVGPNNLAVYDIKLKTKKKMEAKLTDKALEPLKQIGWNIKVGVSHEAVGKLVTSEGWKGWYQYKVHFIMTSFVEKKLKELGVLEALCEPVYEETKKFIDVRYERTGKTLRVQIHKNYAEHDTNKFSSESLKKALRETVVDGIKFKPTYFNIGCEAQYHNVSAEDIQKVVDALEENISISVNGTTGTDRVGKSDANY